MPQSNAHTADTPQLQIFHVQTWESSLHAACGAGDIKLVRQLLEDPKTDVNLQDEYGNTPLMVIFNLSKYLLPKGCKGEYERTSRHDAIAHILFQDQRTNRTLCNRQGKTLLDMLCSIEKMNHVIYGMLQALFNDAHDAQIDVSHRRRKVAPPLLTAFHTAFHHNAQKTLQLLLRHLNKDGNTLLHIACKAGDAKAVTQLLQRVDIGNVNVLNKAGYSPFHLACAAGHHEVVRILLADSRVDPFICTTAHRNNGLHLAVLFGHPAVVELLLAQQVFQTLWHQHNELNLSPMGMIGQREAFRKLHETAGDEAFEKTIAAHKEAVVARLIDKELHNLYKQRILEKLEDDAFYKTSENIAKMLIVKILPAHHSQNGKRPAPTPGDAEFDVNSDVLQPQSKRARTS